MDKYICIHGHFYQPPRENPWLEEVELQDGAYPYHDWNEKITAQCYRPNAASRILDKEGRIVDIVNNYSKISFNLGPTLASWMERNKPEVYRAILEADRLSIKRFSGHGSAIAQVYNHMIMPLANKRDKCTQAAWGIKDFQKRFRRFPEGMWLPETAVDIETLEVLAELGIKFTILSPIQAKRVKKKEESEWQDVSGGRVDPTMPYLCILPSGRAINLFFYDGPISRDIAFGELLSSGEAFARRLLSAFSDQRGGPQLVHIATDGETYGHHHRFGDMALAYCLYLVEANNLAKITNYGEYLEKYPPTYIAEISENSSWSCCHGIERWRDNCGCNTGLNKKWTQAWRKPLREAMDGLRDRLVPLYKEEASRYFSDPWKVRNDYIEVILDRSRNNTEKFLRKHTVKALSIEEKIRVLKLLEVQRNAMLMFTSCGWFFDDISGIETTQVMQYAARAIQLTEELFGISVEEDYLSTLEKAPANIPKLVNGRSIYETLVKPAMLDLMRVGAHYAISSIFDGHSESTAIYCYTVTRETYNLSEAGRLRLAAGRVKVVSDITWDQEYVCFAVLHLGEHNIIGGIRINVNDEAFSMMYKELTEVFDRGDISKVIRAMDKYFGANNYSLWHLFKDEQRKVLNHILRSTLDEAEASFRQIYEDNYGTMNFLHEVSYPLPSPLLAATEVILNTDIRKVLEEEKPDLDKLKQLISAVKRWTVNIDKPTLSFAANSMINTLSEKLNLNSNDLSIIETLEHTIRLLRLLALELDLSNSQNIYFCIGQTILSDKVKEREESKDEKAGEWLDAFCKLGHQLHVKVL
ncbi:MAG: DUF3536 domain-containing protein [Desulfobacterales bacterium]|nr:DUF3536 domain-containing protein [Desulfobacterales bacterium]